MKKLNFWKKSNSMQHKPGLMNKLLIGLMVFASSNAFASSSGSSFPFVDKLKNLADAISGSLALSVATILIVATGLMNAFGEWGDGMKKLINVAFWCSIAFGVASLIATFGGSGATF